MATLPVQHNKIFTISLFTVHCLLLTAVSTAGNFGHCLVVHHQHQGTKWYVEHVDKDHGPPGAHHSLLGLVKGYLRQAGGGGGEESPAGLAGRPLSVPAAEVEAEVSPGVGDRGQTVTEADLLRDNRTLSDKIERVYRGSPAQS